MLARQFGELLSGFALRPQIGYLGCRFLFCA
jgi:hypothetical protein